MSAPDNLADLELATIIGAVFQCHAVTVAAWQRNEPGSWGALAGQSVLAVRRALGRVLTDAERRQVWQAAWDQLMQLGR